MSTGPVDGFMRTNATEKIMITRSEGEEWEVIPIHSIVIQGKRWDAPNRRWSDYDFTPEKIEDNQKKRS